MFFEQRTKFSNAFRNWFGTVRFSCTCFTCDSGVATLKLEMRVLFLLHRNISCWVCGRQLSIVNVAIEGNVCAIFASPCAALTCSLGLSNLPTSVSQLPTSVSQLNYSVATPFSA